MGPWELEWDDDNIDHLANHGISPEEVEDLFEDRVVRRRGGTDAPDRVRILGRTAGGRYLSPICQELGAWVLRPITGWDMRSHERELYGRQIGR